MFGLLQMLSPCRARRLPLLLDGKAIHKLKGSSQGAHKLAATNVDKQDAPLDELVTGFRRYWKRLCAWLMSLTAGACSKAYLFRSVF
jgi:hypothetical protein